MFLEQRISISEESYDSEGKSNITEINYIIKFIKIENGYFKL